MALTSQQARRYSRHLTLSEIAEPGQERLLDASVTLGGAGPATAAALDYLVAAGVGEIRLVGQGATPSSLLPLPHPPQEWPEAARQLAARLNPDVRVVSLETVQGEPTQAFIRYADWHLQIALDGESVTLAAASCTACVREALRTSPEGSGSSSCGLFAGAAAAAEVVKRVLGLGCLDGAALVADLSRLAFVRVLMPPCMHRPGSAS